MNEKELEAIPQSDLNQHAGFIEQSVRDWRGESGDEVRRWLEKFWKAKRDKTRREALRRAHECWLCP